MYRDLSKVRYDDRGNIFLPFTLENLREFVRSFPDGVTPHEIKEEFDVSHSAMLQYCRKLVKQRTIVATGSTSSRRYHWRDPRLEGETGPKRKPRGEPKLEVIEGGKRGTPVPYTKPVGPSGKPGYDKKRAAKGMKVKRARMGT